MPTIAIQIELEVTRAYFTARDPDVPTNGAKIATKMMMPPAL